MDELQRADFARQILDNPVYQEVVGKLEADLQAQRLGVKLTDVDAHTKLIMCEQVLARFKGYFTQAVQDGEFRKLDLESRKSPIASVFRR